MPGRDITLDEALHYATSAKDYARLHIKKGSSQLANNKLSPDRIDSLSQAVGAGGGVKSGGTREVFRQQCEEQKSMDPLENDPTLVDYESCISVSTKYSLGNCAELAYQALDYVLNYLGSNVNAEVFNISGGDHVFLIINRDPDSDPQDPTTWGENAVFCDPWSNQVYKASLYLSKLENFYQVNKVNYTEPFDPYVHQLAQIDNINTDYLRKKRTVAILKTNFLKEADHLLKILGDYKIGLAEEKDRIIKKYGYDEESVSILSHRIDNIDVTILGTTLLIEDIISKQYRNNYRFAKEELTKEVKLLNKAVVLSMQFSIEDRDILFAHRGKSKVKNIFIKSNTQSNIEKLYKNANEQISKNKSIASLPSPSMQSDQRNSFFNSAIDSPQGKETNENNINVHYESNVSQSMPEDTPKNTNSVQFKKN